MQLHWSESPPRNLPFKINLQCAKYNDSECSLLKPDCGSILHCVLAGGGAWPLLVLLLACSGFTSHQGRQQATSHQPPADST